nr:MAG TPA: hypothetical protein [Caudoviricetes sp.]
MHCPNFSRHYCPVNTVDLSLLFVSKTVFPVGLSAPSIFLFCLVAWLKEPHSIIEIAGCFHPAMFCNY